jgi:predicted RecA/RadA family phage recombinase
MKNFVKPGYIVTKTHSAAVVSGQAILNGTELVVATGAYAANAEGEYVRAGVVSIVKQPALAIAQGVEVYWDDTNKRITTTASGNTLCGVSDKAALAGDAEVEILLNKHPYSFN